MHSDERRRFPRLTVPAFYRAARLFSSRQPARDLSLGGVRVLSDGGLTVGQRLEIELFLPDGRSVDVTVRVSWIAPHANPQEAAFEAGLEFMELSSDRAALLEECLAVSAGRIATP